MVGGFVEVPRGFEKCVIRLKASSPRKQGNVLQNSQGLVNSVTGSAIMKEDYRACSDALGNTIKL